MAYGRAVSGSDSLDAVRTLDGGGGEGSVEDLEGRRIGHYRVLIRLGEGSSGIVYRVWDERLQRHLAAKVIRRSRAGHPAALRRFRDEALLVARLQHPAIIPILDWGIIEETGQPFFVMPEVQGPTLAEAIQEAHPAGPERAVPPLAILRRLVGILRTLADAVAYAHTQGVLHRDLKPSNVMLGPFGEIRVVDWGLARALGGLEPPPVPEAGALSASKRHTRLGAVVGTVPWMPPEQARGEWNRVDQRADVFALGAILRAVLTGAGPWPKDEPLEAAREGRLRPWPEHLAEPALLVEIARHATQPDPRDRFESAKLLAHELARWLEGAAQTERARKRVEMADAQARSIRQLQEQAELTARAARELLAGVPRHAPEEAKHEGWALEDEAERLRMRVLMAAQRRDELLHEALNLAPDLLEAHDRLAELAHERHRRAIEQGDALEAARQERLLRRHDRRGRYRQYLRGRGAWRLRTSHPVHVRVARLTLVHRRMHPGEALDAGSGRWFELELPEGRYVAWLTREDGTTFTYPLVVQRDAVWSGAPDPEVPFDLEIPQGRPPPRCVWVPPSPFQAGGDPQAFGAPLPGMRLWCGGFWIQRQPVTNRDYLAFLDDLVRQGREEEAEEHVPRERGAGPGQLGERVYGRQPDGTYFLKADADGDRWELDWPVVMVRAASAEAYARWLGELTGLPYRLPWEIEWEKAARGVDGSVHVWGTHHFDPSWCCMAESHGPNRPMPAPVQAYPADRSIYGVRGLAGNVLDICADLYRPAGPEVEGCAWRSTSGSIGFRVVRGGNWAAAKGKSRAAFRGSIGTDTVSPVAGFRLVVAWGDTGRP